MEKLLNSEFLSVGTLWHIFPRSHCVHIFPPWPRSSCCQLHVKNFKMSIKNSHRLFLRTLMSRQFLSEKEVKRVYQQSCEAYDGNGWTGYDSLSFLKYQILNFSQFGLHCSLTFWNYFLCRWLFRRSVPTFSLKSQ